MALKNRMVEAEYEYLKHLAADGRDIYARGTEYAAIEASLTPGAVVSTVVTVQGQVVDVFGNPVLGVQDVLLATHPITGGQGTIAAASVPVGTVKQGSGTASVWMQTNTSGAFAVAVTDTTGGELCLMESRINDGLTVTAELQF